MQAQYKTVILICLHCIRASTCSRTLTTEWFTIVFVSVTPPPPPPYDSSC